MGRVEEEHPLLAPVWIAGVGMTPFGAHGTQTVKELTARAVMDALRDADLQIGDVQTAFFGNVAQSALEGQISIGGQVALRAMGFERIPIFNVENACATGASALSLAVNHVRAGVADVALAVGVERMNIGDRTRTMAVFGGGYDVTEPAQLQRTLVDLGGPCDGASAGTRSIFMDIYAAMARSHMAAFGTTQRQLAAVASKNHRHAVGNDRAHFRTEMTVEEVLSARRLSYPLTVPMCAPITDGAAAALVISKAGLRRTRKSRAVSVLANVIATGVGRPIGDYGRHIARLAAHEAYEQAGVEPAAINLAEVHDATSFGEILMTEMLGLVAAGDGGAAAEQGATTLGGRIPVNPSGGLESKGHPLGATGLAQVYELVLQLRGEAGSRQVPGARLAIAENGGGFHGSEEAVAAITVLGT